MHNLDGKVALVTGGTRGIGRGIAEAFLSAGASVAINGRSAEKGAATIREWSAGDRAFYVAGDVTQREEVEAMVDATLAQFGRIDILVNNAGGALARISERVTEIADQMAAIAASAREQSAGLDQISAAVTDMDRATQQKVAMIEETAAASQALQAEAEQLAEMATRFRVAQNRSAGRSPAPGRRAS